MDNLSERAAIVAWLRGMVKEYEKPALTAYFGPQHAEMAIIFCGSIANAVERGDHLNNTPPTTGDQS